MWCQRRLDVGATPTISTSLNCTPIRRRRIHRSKPKIKEKAYRVNERIFADPVRLVDEAAGSADVMPLRDAFTRAREKGLDLVEVSPLANPPVVKIVDFGQFRYQQDKLERKQRARQKTVETKGIRLTLKMSKHDIEVRTAQATKFLENGDKVKIDMLLRGREQAHIDLAKKIIHDFVKSVPFPVKLEDDIQREGGRLGAIMLRQ